MRRRRARRRGEPVDGTVEIGGPERFTMDELVRTGLSAAGDPRAVVVDREARYFGARLDDDTLLPGEGASLATTTYAEWLATAAR